MFSISHDKSGMFWFCGSRELTDVNSLVGVSSSTKEQFSNQRLISLNDFPWLVILRRQMLLFYYTCAKQWNFFTYI